MWNGEQQAAKKEILKAVKAYPLFISLPNPESFYQTTLGSNIRRISKSSIVIAKTLNFNI
jgi:hypothetical protein